MTDVPEGAKDKRKATEGMYARLDDHTKKSVILLASNLVDESSDLYVFEQDESWVVGGVEVPLVQMDREAVVNLVASLFASAENYHVRMVTKIAAELLLLSVEGHPDPDLPVVKAAHSILNTEAVEWLNSTPLMRKLTELLDSLKDH
jgi:hypothetical protein